jgi:translation elongation factor EF-1alpha
MMFRCSQALAVVLFAVVITVNNVVVAKDMKKSKKTKPFSKPPPSVTSLLRAVQFKSEDFTFIPVSLKK